MSKWALILGGVAVGALAIYARLEPTVGPIAPTQIASQPAEIKRHAFLDGLELGGDGNGYALILHPMATHGESRAVLDPSALRAAQDTAFFTDIPDDQKTSQPMPIAFVSQSATLQGDSFVTLLRNKQAIERFTCYPAYCNMAYDTDRPHSRDLAGLLEASMPIEQITETYRIPAKIHAAHFRAMHDPEVIQITAPDLPPLNKFVFPHRIKLHLPAMLREADSTGNAPLTPFDEADYMARLTAAFEHAYPMTEAYRFRDLTIKITPTPPTGWPVVSSKSDGNLRNADGTTLGIDRVVLIEPTISIELAYRMSQALKGDDPFDLMPAFSADSASLKARLDTLAEAELGQPCKGCFNVQLPETTTEMIKVIPVDPISYSLSYTRIKTP